MGIFSSKPQRFKAEIKGGKPTGRVVQTNKRTQGATTAAKHAAVKKITGKK